MRSPSTRTQPKNGAGVRAPAISAYRMSSTAAALFEKARVEDGARGRRLVDQADAFRHIDRLLPALLALHAEARHVPSLGRPQREGAIERFHLTLGTDLGRGLPPRLDARSR